MGAEVRDLRILALYISALADAFYFVQIHFTDFSKNKHAYFIGKVPHDFKAIEVQEMSFSMKEECFVHDVLQTNLFFLSLFVETSRVFGCPTSVRTNHRCVDYSGFTSVGLEGTSIADVVEKENSRYFQNHHVYPFPYCVENVDVSERVPGVFYPEIRSFGPAHYSWKTKKKGKKITLQASAELVVENVSADLLTKRQYEAVCFFFGVQPRFYRVNGTNEVVFDWRGILTNAHVANGSSVEGLSTFCNECGLPFVCDGDDAAANNRQMREFVQYCLPLRFAMVEGNHRMELCCRRFYGMHLLSKYSTERTSVPPPPRSSTMCAPMSVRIIEVPGFDELSAKLLSSLEIVSMSIQKESAQLIASSWKTFMHQMVASFPKRDSKTYQTLLAKVGCDPVTGEMHKSLEYMKDFISDRAIRMNLLQKSDLNEVGWANDKKKISCGRGGMTHSILGLPTMDALDKSRTLEFLRRPEFYMIIWLVSHFGTHQKGVRTLRKYFSSTFDGIYDNRFLTVFVGIPVNAIVEQVLESLSVVLIRMYDMKKSHFTKGDARKKLRVLYKSYFGEMYLKVLWKYGRYPEYKDQAIVDKMMAGPFGRQAIGKDVHQDGKKSVCAIDGITQVVLYFWPKLFFDTQHLESKLEEVLDEPRYCKTFLSYLPEFDDKVDFDNDLNIFEGNECFCIPDCFNVFKMFPSILDGSFSLDCFISDSMVSNGFCQPMKAKRVSPKKKKASLPSTRIPEKRKRKTSNQNEDAAHKQPSDVESVDRPPEPKKKRKSSRLSKSSKKKRTIYDHSDDSNDSDYPFQDEMTETERREMELRTELSPIANLDDLCANLEEVVAFSETSDLSREMYTKSRDVHQPAKYAIDYILENSNQSDDVDEHGKFLRLYVSTSQVIRREVILYRNECMKRHATIDNLLQENNVLKSQLESLKEDLKVFRHHAQRLSNETYGLEENLSTRDEDIPLENEEQTLSTLNGQQHISSHDQTEPQQGVHEDNNNLEDKASSPANDDNADGVFQSENTDNDPKLDVAADDPVQNNSKNGGVKQSPATGDSSSSSEGDSDSESSESSNSGGDRNSKHPDGDSKGFDDSDFFV